MLVIVGLGNPGTQYNNTRHNAGFLLVDLLSERWNIPLRDQSCRSLIGEGQYQSHDIRLVQPQTSMNLSGQAVRCLVEQWKLELSQLLIVCDDVALPLGKIRLRPQGSDGGQQGLADVLAKLGSQEVARFRIGIGPEKPVADLVDFVLTPFSTGELKTLDASLERAAQACESMIDETIETAMNKFNSGV